jgi:hypothetical protein
LSPATPESKWRSSGGLNAVILALIAALSSRDFLFLTKSHKAKFPEIASSYDQPVINQRRSFCSLTGMLEFSQVSPRSPNPEQLILDPDTT